MKILNNLKFGFLKVKNPVSIKHPVMNLIKKGAKKLVSSKFYSCIVLRNFSVNFIFLEILKNSLSFVNILVSFGVRCINSLIDSIVLKNKKVPYPKRDIIKLPISFGFHGKLEAVGKIFLVESYITKFNATFLKVVSTVLR